MGRTIAHIKNKGKIGQISLVCVLVVRLYSYLQNKRESIKIKPYLNIQLTCGVGVVVVGAARRAWDRGVFGGIIGKKRTGKNFPGSACGCYSVVHTAIEPSHSRRAAQTNFPDVVSIRTLSYPPSVMCFRAFLLSE